MADTKFTGVKNYVIMYGENLRSLDLAKLTQDTEEESNIQVTYYDNYAVLSFDVDAGADTQTNFMYDGETIFKLDT